ncbi:MAG: tetratricopeptide repeat protein [Nitrospirota bacterium]
MKDNKNDLISPEIVKLTEKMTKDPASTLFFPLAEEYRKCGMLDEAIILLTDGLKNHPNFLSARVSLGKIYLQKGIIPDARQEFEKVVQFAPDNLLAQKKLAIIYRDEGERDKALDSCRRLLLLNPNDEEIKKIQAELEAEAEKKATTEFHAEEVQPVIPLPEVEKKGEEPVIFSLEDDEGKAEETEKKEEEEEIGINSSPVYEINDEDLDLKEIFSVESPAWTKAEEKEEKEEEASISDIFKTIPDQEEKGEEIPVYEITDTDEEVLLENILVGREKVEETHILEEEIPVKEEQIVSEAPPDSDKEGPSVEEGSWVDRGVNQKDESLSEEIASESLAELYIRQEQFAKAAEILSILLSKDPSNETLRQKVEDAVTLKNLMGGEMIPGGDYTFREEPARFENDEKGKVVTPAELARQVTEGPEVPWKENLESAPPEGHAEDAKKVKKIKRLEQWLENIKRSHD